MNLTLNIKTYSIQFTIKKSVKIMTVEVRFSSLRNLTLDKIMVVDIKNLKSAIFTFRSSSKRLHSMTSF